ncbi:hypothetical protein CLOM_g1421 [Closterium sp. NIES-68]|nr:hypothetical protein CLOM_g1421 [Closterium sp. NIES-68]
MQTGRRQGSKPGAGSTRGRQGLLQQGRAGGRSKEEARFSSAALAGAAARREGQRAALAGAVVMGCTRCFLVPVAAVYAGAKRCLAARMGGREKQERASLRPSAAVAGAAARRGRTGRRCCNGQKEAPPFPVATVCSGAKAQQEESTPALGRRMLLPFILQAAAAVAGAAERRRGSSGGRCCTSRRRRLCAGGAFFSRSSSVPVLRGARRGRRAGVWRNGERNSSSLHHPPSTVLDPPSSIHYLPSSIHHSAAVAGAAARRGQH